VTDYPDWTVPQANANSIAATGVPLLANPGTLLNTTYVINAGANTTPTSLPFNQPGYEVWLGPYETGAGGAGPLEVSMQWLDSTGSQVIATETWDVWPGTMFATHEVYGKGPTKGGILQLIITNTSAAMQYTVPIRIYQRSHLYTRDDWRTRFYTNSASSNLIAPNDPTSGLLGNRSLSINAASSDTSELPLYSGLAYLYFDTSSGLADMTLTIQDSADPNGVGVGTRIQRYKTPAGGIFSQQIALPRYQCRVVMLNSNAGAQTLFYTLHTIEQAV
jgi:hypothetical protein